MCKVKKNEFLESFYLAGYNKPNSQALKKHVSTLSFSNYVCQTIAAGSSFLTMAKLFLSLSLSLLFKRETKPHVESLCAANGLVMTGHCTQITCGFLFAVQHDVLGKPVSRLQFY